MTPCPKCGSRKSWVLRKQPAGLAVLRRRQCDECGKRYATEESVPVKRLERGVRKPAKRKRT